MMSLFDSSLVSSLLDTKYAKTIKNKETSKNKKNCDWY